MVGLGQSTPAYVPRKGCLRNSCGVDLHVWQTVEIQKQVAIWAGGSSRPLFNLTKQ